MSLPLRRFFASNCTAPSDRDRLVSSAGVSDPLDPAAQEEAKERGGARVARARTAIKGLAIDIAPLRESRDFRLLWLGELISMAGRQITVVALPFQVYVLTGSSLAV